MVSVTSAESWSGVAAADTTRTPAGRSSSSRACTGSGSVPSGPAVAGSARPTVTRISPATPLGISSTDTARTAGSCRRPCRIAGAVPLLLASRATRARARSSSSVSSAAAADVGRSLVTVSIPATARCTTVSTPASTAGVVSSAARTRTSEVDSPASIVRDSAVS